jgi:hypothetical protein
MDKLKERLNAMSKWKWHFKKDNVKETLDYLGRVKESLNLALQIDHA